jgi:hypothetical protein
VTCAQSESRRRHLSQLCVARGYSCALCGLQCGIAVLIEQPAVLIEWRRRRAIWRAARVERPAAAHGAGRDDAPGVQTRLSQAVLVARLCSKGAHGRAGDRAPLARCSMHNTTILSEAPRKVWAQLHWPGSHNNVWLSRTGTFAHRNRAWQHHASSIRSLHLHQSVAETMFRHGVQPRAKTGSVEPVQSTVGPTL